MKYEGRIVEVTLEGKSKILFDAEPHIMNRVRKIFDNSRNYWEKEYKISKRSRIDFMVSNEKEKIGIECKIESTNRAAVYRQVRRYIEEANVSGVVLVAPWHGISSFKIDGIPVVVIDTNVNSI